MTTTENSEQAQPLAVPLQRPVGRLVPEREDMRMLALAADAIGLQWEWHQGCGDALRLTATDARAIYWNPLADDGDALRLAVDLALTIEFGNDGSDYTVAWDGYTGSGKFYHHESDRRNATRFAIVTIAAQADPKTPNRSS